jgi:hypothetical protein
MMGTSVAFGDHVTVTAVPIERFAGKAIGEPVQSLVWRGGLALISQDDTFGGLSGVTFTSQARHLAFVTDRGYFVTGQMLYNEADRPFGLVGVDTAPIQNSSGAPLPRQFSRDAEAVTLIERDGAPAGVRVGFENLTRVADFELVDHRPVGAATEVGIPEWLSDARSNEAIEAICIAPPTSPVAGSTLIVTEGVYDDDGNHRAWLIGNRDRGDLSYRAHPGVNPTDCAFLPNGDLLVLERGVAFIAFTMRLRRIAAADIRPGALMDGEVLLEARGGDVDNMEGLAVHTLADGETRIVIVSDDNFNDWQRTLWLEFALPR